ncbi:hypothetical protein Emag_000083 [Eimeria magna]
MADDKKGASDSLDGTLMCLMCCRNFWTDILKLSIVSYFFWVGLIYFVGAVILLTGYTYSAPRVNTEIACPMTSSVYVFVALWLFQISVWTIDLIILPDCNASGLRWIVALTTILWWAVVALGARAKRKILVPAYLYDPLRPGQGVLREVRHLLRGFGP